MKKPFVRPFLAAILIGVMAGTPVAPTLAQEPSSAAQTHPAPQGGVPISLGVSKHDYTHGRSAFPRVWLPYSMHVIAPGALANSPRLEQLIKDAKLELSLQDAIALALENSMDIVVTRYNPWIADVSLLKTQAGGYGYGTPGSVAVGSTASLPSLNYDPILTETVSFADATVPINNPFLSGTAGTGTAQRTTPSTSSGSTWAPTSASPGTTTAPRPTRPTSSIPTCLPPWLSPCHSRC
jgi:hypothetical protein